MDVWNKVNALEDAHCRRAEGAEPSLWKAYDLLLGQWHAGVRDRETTLRLAFLAWFSWSEPNFLTGLNEAPPSLIADLFGALECYAKDEEVSFALHVMIEVYGDILANQDTSLRALIERNQTRLDRPYTLNIAAFEGRGAYGEYFGGQAEGQSQYVVPGETLSKVTIVRKHDA